MPLDLSGPIHPIDRPIRDIPVFIKPDPDFEGFAAAHPWIGSKIGERMPIGGGFGQKFDNAWVWGVVGRDPHETHGGIGAKYEQLGGPAGILGFPTTDETVTPDGQGRFNHFDHGSIYWHPSIGAFEVHGAIRDKWAALGWEAFGYPLTDESATLDGIGRLNHFRSVRADGSTADASIYWTPDTGANEVHGAIRDTWSGLGWETSFLGYPISDEHDSGGGRASDFQNGSIFWTAGSGAQVQPQAFVVNAPSITFGTGIAIGGSGTLTLFSDGTTKFRGHLHDSGFPSYDCLAIFAVKDANGRVYAANHTGRTHGTDEAGSRDLDWEDWGTNDDVRRNWSSVRSGGTGNYRVEVTSDWSPQKIAEDILAVVGIVLAIIPLIFSGGSSNKSADPNYVLPDGSEGYQPGAAGAPPPLS
jgi:hypothetical protein